MYFRAFGMLPCLSPLCVKSRVNKRSSSLKLFTHFTLFTVVPLGRCRRQKGDGSVSTHFRVIAVSHRIFLNEVSSSGML